MTKEMKQPHDGPTRAGVYVRVAQADESSANNLAAQQARVEHFCGEKGLDVVGVYTDIGSGHLANPGLQKALSDASEGCFDVLVVERLDRLSRRWTRMGEIIDQLEAAAVSVRALDGFDSASSAGALQRQILNASREMECVERQERRKERRRDAQDEPAGSPHRRHRNPTNAEEEPDGESRSDELRQKRGSDLPADFHRREEPALEPVRAARTL
jgi:DNA invertase Pin-like site-specific DNA recombinase